MDEEVILPTSCPYHPEQLSLLILVAQIYLTSLRQSKLQGQYHTNLNK